jgi:hypothetical protein
MVEDMHFTIFTSMQVKAAWEGLCDRNPLHERRNKRVRLVQLANVIKQRGVTVVRNATKMNKVTGNDI